MSASLVLDTNIVLDLFVFADAAAQPLRQRLSRGQARWLATQAMRDELAQVLDYSQIAARLSLHGLAAGDVLACFDSHSQRVAAPPRAPLTCKDADDQKFIDLAVAHGALLLSRDRAVLRMARRLAALQVTASAVLPATA